MLFIKHVLFSVISNFVYRSGMDQEEQPRKKEIFEECYLWMPMKYSLYKFKQSDTYFPKKIKNNLQYTMIDSAAICGDWADKNLGLYLSIQAVMFISFFSCLSLLLPISISLKLVFVLVFMVHAAFCLYILDGEIVEKSNWVLIAIGNISALVLVSSTILINSIIMMKSLGIKNYIDYQSRLLKNAISSR